LTTTYTTGTTGSNKTNFATRNGVPFDSSGMTNMLMITTTVRMLNRVHSHTSNTRPAVSLDSVFVESATSLQHRLVDTTTTGNDTDLSSADRLDGLLGAGWETDTGFTGFRVVRDDSDVVTRGTSEFTTVSWFLFTVRDDGTFRHRTNRQDVSDLEFGFLTTVDELSTVDTFGGDESFLYSLEFVWVTESNFGEWGTTTGVMDESFNYTLNVSISFTEIVYSELSGSFV